MAKGFVRLRRLRILSRRHPATRVWELLPASLAGPIGHLGVATRGGRLKLERDEVPLSEHWVSGCSCYSRLDVARLSCSNHPAAEKPRRLLVDEGLGGGRRSVCIESQVDLRVLSPNGRRLRVERTAVLVAVGVGRPSSGLCPTGSVSSPPSSLAPTSGAAALLQGEEDVGPGAVDLSNPAVRLG